MLDIVDSFKYLGVVFKFNGKFDLCKERLLNLGKKAMFNVIIKCRKFNLPVDLQLDLFDKMVIPILIYGCEVWGSENTDIIEKLHLKFCKMILNVKNGTPNVMIYGELGRYPLYIEVYTRMIKYWAKINTSYDNKLVLKMYRFCKFINEDINWCTKVKEILFMCGFYDIWNNDVPVNPDWISLSVNQKLKDLYLSEWRQTVDSSSKCYLYRIFKTEISFENYLLLNWNLRKQLCKLRTVNHKLPVETGRYRNIPRNQRFCTLCNENILCDEFHIIFKCKKLVELRKKFLPHCILNQSNISVLRLKNVFQCSNKNLINLALFAKHSLKLFK